jgi:23S rRNA (uracil1939-C5)-methyltransferase
VVREGRRTGQLQVRLITGPGEIDRAGLARAVGESALGESAVSESAVSENAGVLWTRTAALAETTQGGETELIAGSAQLEEELGGMRFLVSPEAFFQTNTEMAERLYATALEYAGLRGFERVYDLYSGIGTIGLLMAPRAAEVWGLEVVEQAVVDARRNARRNEVDNVRFTAGDVRLGLRELVQRAGRPDVVVVDPPRAGLSQKVVRRIIEAGPHKVVYVSCNPTTLAPNAAQLEQAGYTLTRARPVDMFAQTPHIEVVAALERRRG